MNVENMINEKTFESETDYSKWTIDEDVTIGEEENCYGIEIISPVFKTLVHNRRVAPGEWKTDIQKVWTALERYFDVVTEYRHQCGTHIHISPIGGFDQEQVRSFACFLTCSSDRISEDIPLERRKSEHAVPNFQIRPRPSLNALQAGMSTEHLVDVMMPTEEDMRRVESADRKYVAWNFLPLLDPKGTIEFRQPPHARNVEEALHWVTVTLLWSRQALRWNL